MTQHFPQIVATAVVLLVTPSSKFILGKITKKYASVTLKTEARTEHMVRTINMLVNCACFLFLAIIWGVEPKNMLVAFSSIFAVIGVALFAQWSLLSNVTAGIIIFFTTPFRVGDEIHILDKDLPIDATIEAILTFYTYLRTKEGKQIVMPNSFFLQKIISLGSWDE